LGNFGDLRTQGQDGPVSIELLTSGGGVELGFGGIPDVSELLLSLVRYPFSENASSTAQVVGVNSDIASPATGSTVSVSNASHSIRLIDANEASMKVVRVNRQQWQQEGNEASVILDGLLLKAVQRVSVTQRPLSSLAGEELKHFFESLTYLRATRQRPQRGFRRGVAPFQPMGYSGEYASTVLHQRAAELVSYYPPPPIPDSVQRAREVQGWSPHRLPLAAAVTHWLGHLSLATKVETSAPDPSSEKIQIRVGIAGNPVHDITEVGFGVSQVFPILIAGLLQAPDSLFIVDLPEAHLHPRPQAELADFFCAMVKSGRHVLVETHSEMFFHRLRLRAAMDEDLMKKIGVYFVDPPRGGICCEPRPVGLRFEDELLWPEGFLQEGWETEAQISAVRAAKQTRT
jgi:hypothetical protein